MMEFGLIGEKLGHSYSPGIHRIFGDYEYKLYPMPKEELEKTLRERNFRGLNITIPYKTDVLPFCDEISPVVQKVGSANTLIMRGGKLCAYNTDLAGFLFMLKKGGIFTTANVRSPFVPTTEFLRQLLFDCVADMDLKALRWKDEHP